jgi:hypothetical protein
MLHLPLPATPSAPFLDEVLREVRRCEGGHQYAEVVPNLEPVLRTAREAVMSHMTRAAVAGLVWSEPTVTEIYLTAAHGDGLLGAVAFNNREEPRVGADWLWWFVDGRGEAFGMLVQAKRIHGMDPKLTFDFTHVVDNELQGARLRSAGEVIGCRLMSCIAVSRVRDAVSGAAEHIATANAQPVGRPRSASCQN